MRLILLSLMTGLCLLISSTGVACEKESPVRRHRNPYDKTKPVYAGKFKHSKSRLQASKKGKYKRSKLAHRHSKAPKDLPVKVVDSRPVGNSKNWDPVVHARSRNKRVPSNQPYLTEEEKAIERELQL